MKREVLRLDWITKSFGSVAGLKYINFNLFAGEIHAVIGANGVGKSTLLRIITGELEPDGGRVWQGEEEITLPTPFAARERGIFNIANHPEVVEQFDLAGNLAMLLQAVQSKLMYDAAHMRDYAAGLIEDWGLSALLKTDTPGYRLTTLERQMLHILCAVANGARILVMDEPFSTLDALEAIALKEILVQVRTRGISLLLTSHSLADVCELADRVSILREGSCAVTIPNPRDQEALNALALRCMTNAPEPAEDSRAHCCVGQKEVFRAEQCQIPGLQTPLRFNVRAGEVLGIISFGAVRISLCEKLFGLGDRCSGSFWVDGKSISLGTPAAALRAGIALMSDDDEYQKNFHRLSVCQNITLPFLEKLFPRKVLKPRMERHIAQRFESFLMLDEKGLDQPARHLSRGMQKRLALARWFSMPHRLLMLSEPAKGLDVGGQQQLEQMILESAETGTGFIIEFSNIDRLLSLCDRVILISDSRVLGTLSAPHINQQAIFSTVLSNSVPGGDYIV